MLDSIVSEDNKKSLNLHSLCSDLKSIRNRMNIINNVFKVITGFESLTELDKKLTELKENHSSLNNISNEINMKRRYFEETIKQDYSFADENEEVFREVTEELGYIEHLHQTTTLE